MRQWFYLQVLGKMIKEIEYKGKVSPTEKWNLCNSVPFFNILNMSACAPVWHMACKKGEIYFQE